MQQIGTEKVKLNLARIKKAGQIFEINVDPDKAILFKKGGEINMEEVLKTDNVFSDAKKGEIAPDSSLDQAFGTTDYLKIAEIIIKQGEIQLTSEYRSQEREKKKNKIIELINRNAIDPSNNLPHPPQRIELALQEAKVKIDEHKSAEEQIEDILSKLKPIIPIKFETSTLIINVPATYAAKSYSLIKKYAKVLKEEWNSDGSWSVISEIPAGLKMEFIEKLNSFTHGEVSIKED